MLKDYQRSEIVKSFENLSNEERITLTDWIKKYLKPQKVTNMKHSSYGIKHFFENDVFANGFYVNNITFKGAMIACGFEPKNEDDLNWLFGISELSFTYLRNIRGTNDV